MKQLLVLICAMLACSLGFAGTVKASLNKSSERIKALNSALHSYHSLQPTLDKNDIEVGYYGGEDISHPHGVTPSTTVA